MKTYTPPFLSVHTTTGELHLLNNSIKLGGDKVSDSSDIGFVRKKDDDENFWEFEWSE